MIGFIVYTLLLSTSPFLSTSHDSSWLPKFFVVHEPIHYGMGDTKSLWSVHEFKESPIP